MELGIYGLGRMGGNMVDRLREGRASRGRVEPQPRASAMRRPTQGAVPAYSLEEMVEQAQQPRRVVWLMVPSGQVTDDADRHVP